MSGGPGPPLRWVVDGMNVIGSRPDGWWRDRPAAARRLAEALGAFAAREGEGVLLVLDGPAPAPPAPRPPGLEVVGAPGGRGAADEEIVRRLGAHPQPERLVVVTSDAALAARARSLGASVEGAGAFRRRAGV